MDSGKSQQPTSTLINSGNIGACATSGGTAVNIIQQHYTGFAPEMLHAPLEKILEEFQKGNKNVARGQLKVIQSIGGQDPKIVPTLEVVSIYLNMLEAEETEDTRKHLTEFLASQPATQSANLLEDLCVASLIRLEVAEGYADKAFELWERVECPGLHTKETYFAILAKIDDLKGVVCSRASLLTIPELRGVVNGSIRLNDYLLADKAINYLLKLEDQPGNRALQLFISAGLIQPKLDNKHFWSLSATLHDELNQLAEKTAELLILEPLPDSRLPQFAARLLSYTLGESKTLEKACWSKIQLLEQADKECAAFLRFTFDNDATGLSESGKQHHKAKTDESFREKRIIELTSSTTLMTDDCYFLARYAEPETLKTWLDKNGTCEAEDDLASEFFILFLNCFSIGSATNGQPDTRKLKGKCESFIERFSSELQNINPNLVIDMAGKLLELQLPSESCSFIQPLLPNGDFWKSPLLICYMDALLRAEKKLTLSELLKEIPGRHWDGAIWRVKAQLLYFSGDLPGAKQALERGAACGPSVQTAVALIDIIYEMGNDSEISDILRSVPDNILVQDDTYSCRLILEMFIHDLHDRAENILLDWFITNPQSSSVVISDIVTNLTTRPETINFDSSASDFVGVKYHDGKNSLTRLIVPPEKAKDQHLLSSSSPLGQSFVSMAVGDVLEKGIVTYRLEERLPALVAAYRISLEIRDSRNQGDDSFHLFNIPDDPTEFLEKMQKLLNSNRDRTNRIGGENILPIMYKGYLLQRNSPFETALGVLSDFEVKKQELPDFDSDQIPDKVLLDVYALSYLSITGLTPGLTNLKTKLYLSVETERDVIQWLQGRQRDNGGMMTALPDGSPLLLTTEEMRNRTEHIAGYVQQLLDSAEVMHLPSTDLKTELIEVRDHVDLSVFSTLRLASTMSIPWLCIDLNMAKVIDGFGVPVVKNCKYLMGKISELTPFTDRKYGLSRHAYEKLPFSVQYQDLQALSSDKETSSVLVLSKLLRMYPYAFPTTEKAASAMTGLFMPILGDVWCKGALDEIESVYDARFPAHIVNIANTCFYVVSISEPTQAAEYNLSLLLSTLFKKIASAGFRNQTAQRLVEIIAALASNFLTGHFMDFDLVNHHISSMIKSQSATTKTSTK